MERQVTASQVAAAMKRRRLTQFDLASAAGLSQPTISAVLRGSLVISPEPRARLEAAIAELRLDEPIPPDPHEPVFTIRRESDE
jgi:transcriptional regulator with XRE-family HTH domain